MCFSVQEAVFLARDTPFSGDFRDFLVAYPTVQPADIDAAFKMAEMPGKVLTLMIDSEEYVRYLGVISNFVLYCQSLQNSRRALGRLGQEECGCSSITSVYRCRHELSANGRSPSWSTSVHYSPPRANCLMLSRL